MRFVFVFGRVGVDELSQNEMGNGVMCCHMESYFNRRQFGGIFVTIDDFGSFGTRLTK
jgi:hypothetical protein